MQRRTFFQTLSAGALGLFGASRASAAEPARQKVVYHVDEVDKIAEALANLRNHVAGVGGPDNADLRIVINGPALEAFKKSEAKPNISSGVENMLKARVGFEACVNTMRNMNIALPDLLPGFVVAEKGGVVRLAELQMQGYAYLKP